MAQPVSSYNQTPPSQNVPGAAGISPSPSINSASSLKSLEQPKKSGWKIIAWLSNLWKSLLEYFFPAKKTAVSEKPVLAKNVIQGKIEIHLRTTGYVGQDRKYEFGKNLQLKNGDPLQVTPQDFMCCVQIKVGTNCSYDELPSSLFSAAREGNNIHFIRKGQHYSLELSPCVTSTEVVPFDECFKCVQENLKDCKIEFLYDKDVPDTYHCWYKGVPSIYLSPQTQRIQLGERGTQPLVLANLKSLRTHMVPITVYYIGKKENLLRYQLVACGRPQITILLDRNHLYVHTHDEIELKEGERLLRGSKVHEAFFDVLIHEEGKVIDEKGILAALNDRGILTIDIPLLNAVPEALQAR